MSPSTPSHPRRLSSMPAVRGRALACPRVLAVAVALALAGCGAGSAPSPAKRARHRPGMAAQQPTRRGAGRTTGAAHNSPKTAVPAHPRARARVNPGTLPQTRALPSAATPTFTREMRALWAGVQSGRVGPALAAFFPLAAYKQVKAIADPVADWHSRLLGEFAADLAAAHALLGSDAAGARLLGVRVPAAYAHWVQPGTCYNRVGYWELPNARMVYDEGGEVRSFGIASLISWRGVWYVVHLGAVLRSGAGGEVDDPSSGPGFSAYSGTC